nr:uncharacterized protein LOC107437744 [Parasteatoda tepidariorum]
MKSSHCNKLPKRSFVLGRKFCSGQRKRDTLANLEPKQHDAHFEYPEIDLSYKLCPYPNGVELLKLSELTDLPISRIKEEFQRRRNMLRNRIKQLDERYILFTLFISTIALIFACLFISYCTKQKIIFT